MSHTRCPKCGSGNVVGVAGEWECFDCGHEWKSEKKNVSLFSKAPIITLLVGIALLVLAVSIYALIVSNILGPIEIHVAPAEEGTYASLTLISAPSTLSAGQVAEIVVQLTASANFSASPEVNITATDFTPTESDVEVTIVKPTSPQLCYYTGSFELTGVNTADGVRFYYPHGDTFICHEGDSGQFKVRIKFNTPNPTADGKYRIYIALKS